MPVLATFGYGMTLKPKPGIKKGDIFAKCLFDAQIDLLLDVRYSVWGGYWNPKTITKILKNTGVCYIFKEGAVAFHKLFGAPKSIREVKPFSKFARLYKKGLKVPADPFDKIRKLLKEKKPRRMAIMCCEPFVDSLDNCHRFTLANELLKRKIIDSQVIHLSMDKTYQLMSRGPFVIKNDTMAKTEIEKLREKVDGLEKRINALEEQLETRDRRYKDEVPKMLGFSLIKAGKYFHAVKTEGGLQHRVYIGRNIDDKEKVKTKIKKWQKNNEKWLRK